MTSIVLWIAVVILFWGGWPLVARAAGENGLAGAFVLSVFSLGTVTAGGWLRGFILSDASAFGILAIAGVMMGFGLIAFNEVSTSRLVEVSTVVPIIDTGMLLVTVVGGILFFDESVTLRKAAGLALLIAGIALLGPSLSADGSR